MRKLRVGVWLNDHIKPNKGGAFSYYNELVHAIGKHSFSNAEIVFLTDKEGASDSFDVKVIKGELKKSKIMKLASKVISKLPSAFSSLKEVIKKNKDKTNEEISKYADIIYYLTPDCAYTDFPYIYTLWDLAHLSCYSFPEFVADGNFEYRKTHHDYVPYKALAIFAESEAGKSQISKYLNINSDRIKVVPQFPSNVVHPDCVASKPLKMDENDFFIHYPAQFWPHKNHYNLLLAMPEIIKSFPNIKLAFTGSDKNNKSYILKTAKELGLESYIIDLGFVSTEELKWLYEHSQGLVMPTLLGPTNMPLVEAATLDCPVACTNLEGQMEQLGDYGYYFEGTDPSDIAKKVISMIGDKKRGATRKYHNKNTTDNALRAIDKAFGELAHVRFCWDK